MTLIFFVGQTLYLILTYHSLNDAPINSVLVLLFIGICALCEYSVFQIKKAIKEAK